MTKYKNFITKRLAGFLSNSSSMHRIGNNTIAYGYSQFVTLAIQFIQVPFFLKYWGPDKYGEWLVLTGIPTMLAILNTGVTQASTNRATMEASAGNRPLVRKILQTSLLFTTVVGAVIVTLVTGLSLVVNWSSLLDLTLIKRHDSAYVISIMACYLAVLFQGGVTDICFRIADRASLGVFLLANRRVADLLVCVIALFLGAEPITLAISLLGVQIILLYVVRGIGSKIVGENIFTYKNASKEEFRAILKPSLACLGFPLAQAITMQGSVQILNQVASPLVVVTFTMSRTLMRTIIQIAILANNALKPELSRLIGQGREKEANRVTAKISSFTTCLGLLMYLSLIFAGPKIIDVWGKGHINVDFGELALVGLHAIFNIMWFVNIAAKIAKNNHNREALLYSVSSIASITIWILLKDSVSDIVGASLLLAFPELMMLLGRKFHGFKKSSFHQALRDFKMKYL